MPNLNIYLPEDLDKEVQAASEKWADFKPSRTCQTALRNEVKRMELLHSDTDSVVARLRAQKQQYEQYREQRAKELGISWAKHRASYTELKALNDLPEFDAWQLRDWINDDAPSLVEYLADDIVRFDLRNDDDAQFLCDAAIAALDFFNELDLDGTLIRSTSLEVE